MSTNQFICVSPFIDEARTYNADTLGVHATAVENILRDLKTQTGVSVPDEDIIQLSQRIVTQYIYSFNNGSVLGNDRMNCYVKNMAYYLGDETFRSTSDHVAIWYAAEKIINYLL
jgi:hypothetical protein